MTVTTYPTFIKPNWFLARPQSLEAENLRVGGSASEEAPVDLVRRLHHVHPAVSVYLARFTACILRESGTARCSPGIPVRIAMHLTSPGGIIPGGTSTGAEINSVAL